MKNLLVIVDMIEGFVSYREFNEKYFPEYEFYEIDREKISVHSTMLKQSLKENINYLIPEAKDYFEDKF